ncbi:MAG: ABC transporter ATP-binding protein [Lachnospiraceae bacterium]|nr:ABC transporter ATP-binding protein [Lachnospiraceae bacterium]
MRQKKNIRHTKHPDRILSYFRLEWFPLSLVTLSGILYNAGMTAGPYFEGRMAGRLFEIFSGRKDASAMLPLVLLYLSTILLVQSARCVKRFYVRRFANNTSRSMRHMLYNSLVHTPTAELEQESVGAVMTKAMSDVDACVEGMRKFTTEIFDTGVVLLSYLAMLLFYDWRLTLISCIFTPLAYLIADKLKKTVTTANASYKKSAGRLNDAALDRISNAVTYRVYGRESQRNQSYEAHLADYEGRAIAANLWGTSMQPIYHIISMCGVIPLLYFGGKNVLGTGWTEWDIAAFTTFLSCFTKLAVKSSSAAKLFNAVQKAQVSWKRIQPLLKEYIRPDTSSQMDFSSPQPLKVSHLSFAYPARSDASPPSQPDASKAFSPLQPDASDAPSPSQPLSRTVIRDLSFAAAPGEIIGITGPVASGKSTLGRVFLCESPYQGSIQIGDHELSALSEYERSQLISYMGHQPELMSDTIEENIRLGCSGSLEPILQCVRFDREISEMPDGTRTFTGSGGIRLSGGQQARTALARTLYHKKKLLILDDPFSAVDQKTEKEIMADIRNLAKDQIILLISHRLCLFPEFDQVIWLNEGTETVSTHRELMKNNALYAQLYLSQTRQTAPTDFPQTIMERLDAADRRPI